MSANRALDREKVVQTLKAAARRSMCGSPATAEQCQVLADFIVRFGNVSLYEHLRCPMYPLSEDWAAEMIEECRQHVAEKVV